MTRSRSFAIGLGAVSLVVLLQSFNSFACYKHDLGKWADSLLFVAVPMLPAIVSLATRKPLRAAGASALFAPWLVYAYYVDCVTPYEGGGASMVYVAVLLFGFPCALLGALLTDPIVVAITEDEG